MRIPKSAGSQRPSARPQAASAVSPARNDIQDHAPASKSIAWSLSKIPVFSPSPRPATHAIASPTPHADPLEREADAAARLVTSDPRNSATPQTSNGPRLSRGPAATNLVTVPIPSSVHRTLQSPGQPLDHRTLESFENRFNRDLSSTRVHTGPAANQSADDVHALAYTVGHDIVFAKGSFAPHTDAGDRLLAHELSHVIQQAGSQPILQRQKAPDKPANQPQSQKYPEFKPIDMVERINRVGGDGEAISDDWAITLNGVVSEKTAAKVIFAGKHLPPDTLPPGVQIHPTTVLLDPIEIGTFAISGLTYQNLEYVEPSIAQLFINHGLEDETKANPELEKARAAFRDRHSGHGEWILDAMDLSLQRATKRNPDLLIAYYNYYASHQLKTPGLLSSFDKDKETGETSSGDTTINPRVLQLESNFPTSDPVSLLGSTLIHEYVHTPQGGDDNPVAAAPKEAKAYAVELFFSERMGDKKRVEFIEKRYSGNDPVDLQTGSGKIFDDSYKMIAALYKLIDQGGPEAAKARRMSVEFISSNEGDYSPELKKFLADHRR